MGSSFHLDLSTVGNESWLPTPTRLFGTARAALCALIQMGVAMGWRRLYLPDYYCHEVTRTLLGEISIELYHDKPNRSEFTVELTNKDAILIVEYFGRKANPRADLGTIILDRTHDPAAEWEYESRPHYVITSLRKYFPLPDGAAVWSPRGSELPQEPMLTPKHAAASLEAITGMADKAAYLSTGYPTKAEFLERFRAAERGFGDSGISGASQLTRDLVSYLEVKRLRRRRAENMAVLRNRWNHAPRNIELLDVPAFAVLLLPHERTTDRDQIRRRLIQRCIYPAVLWPPIGDYMSGASRSFSARMLAFHVDHRYDHHDIMCLVDALDDAVKPESQ
jgi:hypothetical protein